jgi:hypothetical protein
MEQKLYKTKNTDLAAFLLLEGIELETLEKNSQAPTDIVLVFRDPKSKCLDLERIFISSREKKFRDLHRYLLKQVHAKVREQ